MQQNIKKTLKSIRLSLSIVALVSTFNLSAGELITAQTVFQRSGAISPQLKFEQPETGDIYLAFRQNGQGAYFFLTKEGITEIPTAYENVADFQGVMDLPSFDIENIPSAQYQLYHVTAVTDSNVLDINNWVGGVAGLRSINFSVKMDNNTDLDGDGFHDDDLNRDGFHDDDENRDGFHDDNRDQGNDNNDQDRENGRDDRDHGNDDNDQARENGRNDRN